MQRTDPEVQAHSARMAAQHQAACVPGLSDERLREVAARLGRAGDDPATLARLQVVREELRSRGVHLGSPDTTS
ncbi:MAG TPA: hypothetical protein VGO78_23725 [Acidimicrobiales bacterium]|nr:hypothetical protein [Acidimicrobiales bacterium]